MQFSDQLYLSRGPAFPGRMWIIHRELLKPKTSLVTQDNLASRFDAFTIVFKVKCVQSEFFLRTEPRVGYTVFQEKCVYGLPALHANTFECLLWILFLRTLRCGRKTDIRTIETVVKSAPKNTSAVNEDVGSGAERLQVSLKESREESCRR